MRNTLFKLHAVIPGNVGKLSMCKFYFYYLLSLFILLYNISKIRHNSVYMADIISCNNTFIEFIHRLYSVIRCSKVHVKQDPLVKMELYHTVLNNIKSHCPLVDWHEASTIGPQLLGGGLLCYHLVTPEPLIDIPAETCRSPVDHDHRTPHGVSCCLLQLLTSWPW